MSRFAIFAEFAIAAGLALSLAVAPALAQQSDSAGIPQVLRGGVQAACGAGTQQPCGATVQPVQPQALTGGPPGVGPLCQDNAVPVAIDGKTIEALAHACPQPDGTWQITQETPGLPSQVYLVGNEAPQPPPVSQQPEGRPDAAGAQPTCRDYTVPVTIEGKSVEAKGHACLQPDGSWQVTQETPGLPVQTYSVPPPPANPPPYPEYAYPYGYPYEYPYWAYDPWLYGPPFWFGGFLFVHDFHRFHHFHHFAHHGHGGNFPHHH